MADAPLLDGVLRWLYDNAPIARSEVRKAIRMGVGGRDVRYRNLQWRCEPKDNSVERSLWLYGVTDEEEEIDWLLEKIPAGGAFCDIGANCGIYSLSLRAGGVARILAIEPNPIMRARLLANCALNGIDDIALAPLAVGDAAAKATLRLGSRWDYGQASLARAAGEAIEVEMRPLTAILDAHEFRRLDALKIDVEGFEDSALAPFLRDAPDDLLPNVMVVEHLHAKTWRADLEAWAKARGYREEKRTKNNLLMARS